jgi:uncharacterized protein involved in exopolysaccharide biosynthesis
VKTVAKETPFDFLKVSVDVLRVTFLKNILWVFLAGVLGAGLGAVGTKLLIKNKWTSRCTLYKLPQSAELKKEIPSLYESPDINTVVESIRTRDNILKTIKKLGMDISVDAFYGMTTIQKQKNNTLFTIIAESNDREKSAQVANSIAETFLESYATMMQDSAKKLIEQYGDSENKLKSEMAALDEKMRTMLAEKGITSIDAEKEMGIQKVKEMEMKLLENRAAAETAKIRLQDLDHAISKMSSDVQISYVITPSNAGVLKELEEELNSLLQKFTDENPKVKRVKAEIEALKKKAESKGKPDPEQITYGGNQPKQMLEMEKLKVESEIKAALNNVENYRKEIASTKDEIAKITSIGEAHLELMRQMDLKRQTLSKVESMIASSGLSVKPNSLDIKILEPAIPPTFPDSSKRKLITIFIAVGFMVAAVLAVLGREFFDLTVKTDFDIKEVLRISSLGVLPDKDKVNLSLFNVSFQVVFENIQNAVRGAARPTIVLGAVSPKSGKSLVLSEYLRILIARGKRVLIIRSVEQLGEVGDKSRVNSFVYSRRPFSEFMATTGGDGGDLAYFELDEVTYSYPIDDECLSSFLKSQDKYDIIFWELFAFGRNKRLFSAISRQSDLFILVTRFRQSAKTACLSCVKFLKAQNCRNISGIVNGIHNDYFNT